MSDESYLAENSSSCNLTFELQDATFPSLTPVIDRKDSKFDRKYSASLLLDANGRTRTPIHFDVNLEQPSLAEPDSSSSCTSATPIRERREPFQKLLLTLAPTSSSSPIAPPRIVKKRASTLPNLIPPTSLVAAARGESAFHCRKAYYEVRGKYSLPDSCNNTRVHPGIIATVVAGWQRVDTAAMQTRKRVEDRRQAMDRNRVGFDSQILCPFGNELVCFQT
uniref:Expressed conserved protein n=1 Tax=Echinococcus granulosus TaxID=6210 RepID=A0A068WQT6_ECHGR|nr:expressed conserved protein [Echinococcus granulosus]